MKNQFYKYLFALLITLGGATNLFANPNTTFVKRSTNEAVYHYFNIHKQLPTTHRSRSQSKISFFETIESEDSEASKSKQKPSSIQAKHDFLLARQFFNSLLKDTDVPQSLQLAFFELVKTYSCKIYIQFEVFRI